MRIVKANHFPAYVLAIRSIYGHIDFLGKGATTVLEDVGTSRQAMKTILTLDRKDGLSKPSDPKMQIYPL